MKIAKLWYYIVNPGAHFKAKAILGLYNRLPDEKFVKKMFKARMGYNLDLSNPTTFNEKLQWLKLYDRKEQYTRMVDKYEAKKYVGQVIGEEYVVPLIGVWDTFDEIDFAKMPEQFVLKTTHGCGGMVICRDKDKLDIKRAKKKMEKSLKQNYYLLGREWPYKDVKPRIIAEEYVQNDSSLSDSENLNVYKIMTFSGEPKIIQTIQNDKTEQETIDYFDVSWNLLELKQNFPNSAKPLPKPKTLPIMLKLAEKMSMGMPFLRVDFYEVNGEVKFSEFTFYSDNGVAAFTPQEWDEKMGEWIRLPNR